MNIAATTREVPLGLVKVVAAVSEWVMPVFGKKPLVTRAALQLIGEEVTVCDKRAREEIGYQSLISIDAGMQDLANRFARGDLNEILQ